MKNFVLNAKGSEDYALFPEIKHHLRNFPGAPVRLQEGDQRWGFIHIEFRHKEMLCKQSVVDFVQSILQPGSLIYCEFNNMRENQNVLILNHRIGTVVLCYKYKGKENFYTVVSAFDGKTAKGELIGKLK